MSQLAKTPLTTPARQWQLAQVPITQPQPGQFSRSSRKRRRASQALLSLQAAGGASSAAKDTQRLDVSVYSDWIDELTGAASRGDGARLHCTPTVLALLGHVSPDVLLSFVFPNACLQRMCTLRLALCSQFKAAEPVLQGSAAGACRSPSLSPSGAKDLSTCLTGKAATHFSMLRSERSLDGVTQGLPGWEQ